MGMELEPINVCLEASNNVIYPCQHFWNFEFSFLIIGLQWQKQNTGDPPYSSWVLYYMTVRLVYMTKQIMRYMVIVESLYDKTNYEYIWLR
jgi:lauroyl/myristoyl acyltransferase